MTKRFKKIRVFVASPSDMREERGRLSRVIEELNRSVAFEKHIIIDLVRWETHTTPGMGRPQEIINSQIGPYDIFIGIMWKHFGTPTGAASSGTEEEFELAFSSWRITRKPMIMFYFNCAKYFLNTVEEIEQVRRVLEFRGRLEKQGLIWMYDGAEDFEQAVRQHLQKKLQKLAAESGKRRAKSSALLDPEVTIPNEPVKELFASAFAEWTRHGVFASRDRLELFLENPGRLDLTHGQLRFILESWFKSREYSPQNYIRAYDKNQVIQICIEIIQNEKDADLINGAIKVLGDQDTVKCAEILLAVIEGKNKYQETNRLTAIEQFWFSKIAGVPLDSIPKVLSNVLKGESSFKLRKESAYALRHYPLKEVISALEEALGDSRSLVRGEVVGVLAAIKSPSSIKPLLNTLETERYSEKMRKKIVAALANFATDQRVRHVLESIVANSKEDSQVIKEAKYGLRLLAEA